MRTITDPDRLREELARARERGIAINREESRGGVLGVVAPVIDSDGSAVAALALGRSLGHQSRSWLPAET